MCVVAKKKKTLLAIKVIADHLTGNLLRMPHGAINSFDKMHLSNQVHKSKVALYEDCALRVIATSHKTHKSLL